MLLQKRCCAEQNRRVIVVNLQVAWIANQNVESVHNNIACRSAYCKWTKKATGERRGCARRSESPPPWKKDQYMLLEKHCWGYRMWPNEGATSKANEDSEARKSDQECKEKRKDGKTKTSSTPCSLRVYDVAQRGSCVYTRRGLSSREILSRMQRKQKRSGAKKLEKNFFNSLLTTAA